MNDNYIRIMDTNGVVRIVGIAPPAPNARLEYDGKTLRTHRIWVDIAGSLPDPLQPRIGEALPTRQGPHGPRMPHPD